MPASAPNWVRVSTPGDKNWSTQRRGERRTPVGILQSFEDDRLFAIDLAEDMRRDPAVKLRLLIVEEGDELPI